MLNFELLHMIFNCMSVNHSRQKTQHTKYTKPITITYLLDSFIFTHSYSKHHDFKDPISHNKK